MLYWPAINHSSQSSGWKLQIVPKNQKKKYLKGDQPLRLYTTSIRKFLKEWLHFFSFTGWKVKIAVMALNYSGCQVKLPSVSTHAQQFEQHLITIFSLLLLCGPTESRFSRFREIPSIAKHLRQKKSNALFFFHPKTGWVELFFPLTSLDSFVLLVYLSVFFFFLPLCAIRRIQSTCKCPGSLYRGTLLPCRISAGQSLHLSGL